MNSIEGRAGGFQVCGDVPGTKQRECVHLRNGPIAVSRLALAVRPCDPQSSRDRVHSA